MNKDQLAQVAKAMVSGGKGLLAADESSGTIKKRFDAIGVESTADTRRDYREFMFRAADAMKNHISGVILYDETIRQSAKDGTPLVKLIEAAGSIPGIKVDQGAKPLPNYPGETITEGLDGLAGRLKDYYNLGARFAKWRAVIDIADGIPTDYAVKANAHALARYAALCQEANIVPIVEPEVLMDGAHDIERCYEVTEFVLRQVFDELFEARVFLEGSVLKPNMVISGKKASIQATPEQIAEATVRLFKRCVPVAVPGIAFLSGGQSDVEATANLDAINRLGPLPWAITFSYGRALQAAPQKAWSGKPGNVAAGQAAFAHRARMNSLAALGRWSQEQEKAAAWKRRVHVERGGSGSPTLLLLHGLGATAEVWRNLLPLVERHWHGRWIAPDLPGHGRSAPMPTYSFGAHAAAIAERTGQSEPVAIIGHSMGGAVGLTLATNWFGIEVTHVLALGVKLRWSADDLVRMNALADAPARWFDDRATAIERYLRAAGLTGLVDPASQSASVGIVEENGRYRLAADPRAYRVGQPAMDDLTGIVKVPVRFAAGETDHMVGLEDMEHYDPRAQLIPNAGHNAHVERPDAVWAAFEALLST